MAKQQVAEIEKGAVPAFLQEYHGPVGNENIGQEDVSTPRLVLLQALSPQVEEDDSLKPGEFYHSGAEVGLGSEINVIPLLVTKSYTLWRPRPAGGILARSRDGVTWDRVGSWTDVKLKGGKTVTWNIRDLNVEKSGLADWGSSDPDNEDSPPAAVLAYNIPVLVTERPDLGPVVLSMQRSQIKIAKKLNGRLRLQTVPLCGLSIPLCSVKESGPEGPFFNLRFGKFGYVQQESLFLQAKSLFDMFQEKGVTVQEDDGGASELDAVSDSEIPF